MKVLASAGADVGRQRITISSTEASTEVVEPESRSQRTDPIQESLSLANFKRSQGSRTPTVKTIQPFSTLTTQASQSRKTSFFKSTSILRSTKLAKISARASGSEKTISIKRLRRANVKRLVNPDIVQYLKSKDFREWIGETAEDVEQTIVHKLNLLASTRHKDDTDRFDKEGYEVRNLRPGEAKYVHVRCQKRKCKFNVWFSNLAGKITYYRTSYVSHCPE